tara:strand:+ start:23506 stop:24624 length:1119 start_codon:yes stop_codon:yes gene_type:complete
MAGDISNYGRMKNIYNYPNDVQFNDGHYILFNIFEKAGVDYHRPFTRVSGVAQSAGQATIQKNSFGSLGNNLSKKMNSILQKVQNATGYDSKNLAKVNEFSFDRQTTHKSGAFAHRGKGAKNFHRGSICLYTPPNVNVTHKVNYEEEDIGGIGTLFAGASEAWRKGMESGWKAGVGTAGSNAVAIAQRAAALAGRVGGAGSMQQAMFGTQVNRNFADVIFTGVAFRSFTFEYSFMPANKKEARDVANIVDMFQFFSLPNRRQDSAMTYELPAIFELQYMYFNKINKYLPKTLALGLEDVQIKYGGQKFATFRGDSYGAQPVRTDMTLTFRELEVPDRHSLYGTAHAGDDNPQTFDEDSDDGNAGNDMPPGMK